jgi:hypothetical protein
MGDCGRRAGVDRVGYADDDPNPGSGIGGRNSAGRLVEGEVERGEAGGDRVQIVRIARADAQLDEPPPLRVDEAELFATVRGGESYFASVTVFLVEAGQAELLVVGGCLGDVRDADAD